VSVINKVLQELDRREAMAAADGKLPPQQVRVVHGRQGGREWFWRCVSVLIVAALGWVGWLAWQLQPRPPVATDAAFKAADDAKKNRQISTAQAPAPVSPAAAPVVAQAPVDKPAPPAPKPAEPVKAPEAQKPAPSPQVAAAPAKPAVAEKAAARAAPAPVIDTLKLAFSIETPIAPRAAAQPKSTDAQATPRPQPESKAPRA